MARKKKRRLTAGGKDVGVDLTPMIDIVFQLIIFFMVSLAFVESQVEARLTLPAADAAKPPESVEPDMFIFNIVNLQARIPVSGRPKSQWPRRFRDSSKPFIVGGELMNGEQLFARLKAEADVSRSNSKDGKTVDRGIIIRGDKDTAWIYVMAAMKRCQEAGFRTVYLKALEKTLTAQETDERKQSDVDAD